MSQPNDPYGTQPGSGPYGPQGGAPPPGMQPEPRPALDVGRYWAGAVATIAVAALIGLAAVFVLENMFGLDVDSPPVTGVRSDATAWAVAGALFAFAGAVVLNLLAVSTPRPRSFFGWVIGLGTVVLAALPFAGAVEPLPDLLAAIIWIIMGSAVWSLLTATLSYTYRPA